MNQEEMQKSDLSKYLAHRDGEAFQSSLDAEERALVEDLVDLKRELNALPDVEVDDSVWRPQAPASARHVWSQQRLAMAASVFLVSLVLVTAIGSRVDFGGGKGAVNNSLPLASDNLTQMRVDPTVVALMDQSRNLERIVAGSEPWRQARSESGAGNSGLAVSDMGELILYRLAQTDEQISQLQGSGEVPPELWQKRVNLLQAFIAEMARTNPEQFDTLSSL